MLRLQQAIKWTMFVIITTAFMVTVVGLVENLITIYHEIGGF